MKTVYLFLADEFEEVEGLAVVDILRRAGIQVTMVSIMPDKVVSGSHGINIVADAVFEEYDWKNGDMIVLPGGKKGVRRMAAHEGLCKLITEYEAEGKKIAAICAGPSILGKLKLAAGKKITCYPGFEDELPESHYTAQSVERDGNLITGRGMGVSIDFALAIVEALECKELADRIGTQIQSEKYR